MKEMIKTCNKGHIYNTSVYGDTCPLCKQLYANDMIKEEILNGYLLNTVVNKILLGITEWTLEELQYQQNYPNEIENAMLTIKKANQSNTDIYKMYGSGIFIVPSFYNILQRKAVREKAGPGFRRLLSTPSAIALGHYYDKEVDLRSAIILIEDNFIDISILEIGSGVFEVLATNGETNIDYNIERIITLCNDTLRNVQNYFLNESVTIDELILVGNRTSDPNIRRTIENIFNRKALNINNSNKLKDKGATVYSKVLNDKIKNVVLLDVIPLSIGIETAENMIIENVDTLPIASQSSNGEVVKLICANDKIPNRKSMTFSAYEENQTSMDIHILQGEQRKAADNITIGRFQMNGIIPACRGKSQIEIAFDINMKGILGVTTTNKITGEKIYREF